MEELGEDRARDRPRGARRAPRDACSCSTANTGQNAISQARVFTEVAQVTRARAHQARRHGQGRRDRRPGRRVRHSGQVRRRRRGGRGPARLLVPRSSSTRSSSRSRGPIGAHAELNVRSCWRSIRERPRRARILFDRAGRRRRHRAARVPAALPEAGLGRARSRGDLGEPAARGARRAREGRRRAPGRGRHRHHEPARDDAASGIARTGEPIHPAIVWQSRQTAPICDELRAAASRSEVRARTGLVIDAYFSGTKVRFILDAVPGAQERAERGELSFGTVDSWLLYKLTKGRVHADRVLERVAHAALRHPRAVTGTSRCCASCDIPRRCCPRCATRAASSARPIRSGSGADPDRGHRRRPAGRALRPGLLRRPAAPRTPTAPAASC